MLVSTDELECGIAVLSPCGWGNLGDAAIMDALLAEIRHRCPTASITGITLVPKDTFIRHGILAFPLAFVPIKGGYQVEPESSMAAPGLPNRPNESSVSKPGICRTILKGAVRFMLPAGFGWKLRRDIEHILAARQIVSRISMLVIAGGGQLDDFWGGPWGHPYALLKWTILCVIARVPVIFLSVGYCSLSHRLSRLFIRLALKMATYRSYRDQGSQQLVRKLGIKAPGPVFPDLAFGLAAANAPCGRDETENYQDDNVVAVSPIAYCDPRIWPEKDANLYNRYLVNLAAFLDWVASHGYSIKLFATDSPDYQVVTDLLKLVGTAIDKCCIVDAGVRTVADLRQLVCNVRIVVASRLHGVLISHLSATPVMAISYDRKVTAHMEDMHQLDYCLRIVNVDHNIMRDCFCKLERNLDHIRVALRQQVSERYLLLARQYDSVLNSLWLQEPI